MLDTILCVDDDTITIMLCKKVIEKVDFAINITIAQNGEEALQYFDELFNQIQEKKKVVEPKLVLLDLNMPVMSGWEFLDSYVEKDYQNTFTKTKFIILSSTIDPKDVNKSKSYSIVLDFLSKPITKEMIENFKSIF